jgi:hypothetical protein
MESDWDPVQHDTSKSMPFDIFVSFSSAHSFVWFLELQPVMDKILCIQDSDANVLPVKKILIKKYVNMSCND